MNITKTTLLVGSGGVGKTTTSAALAMAGALSGENVACVSLDPARRLADVLGLPESTEVQKVADADPGQLLTWMPDSRTSVQALLDAWLPPDDALRNNHLVRLLGDALGGMHELASLVHLPASVPSDVNHLVVDTAPGVHALEALSAPQRVRDLFDGPFVRRLIQIFSVVGKRRKRRWFGGSQRIIDALSRAFGEKLTVELADLMMGLGRIQPRILELAKQSQATLRSTSTRAYVVTVPQPKPITSACRIIEMLESTGFRVSGIIVNRTPAAPEPTLVSPAGSPEVESILQGLRSEATHRYATAQAALDRLRHFRPQLPLICLPEFDASNPTAIVRALATDEQLIKTAGGIHASRQAAHG